MKKKNLSNVRFGRLVVLEEVETRKNKQIQWKCLCDCGMKTEVSGCHLVTGHTRSCGCLVVEKASVKNVSHRMTGTRIYTTWSNMKARCYNKNHGEYSSYGGRGIVVCDEWNNSFEKFLQWAQTSGYTGNLTIDRIDNDGNYEPKNCQWITKQENTTKRNREYWEVNRNIRDTVVYFSHLLKSFGISYAKSAKLFMVDHKCLMATVRYRIDSGKVNVLERIVKT